ncbi:MAG: UDP-N-acetylmuramate dehydrogenase [Wolinella sp.]
MKKFIDFSRYTSIKIGGSTEVEIIDEIAKHDFKIIGHGYNLLLSPDAKNMAILDERFSTIESSQGLLKVGAATPSARLFAFSRRENLRGFEMLGSLPGSVGGLVKMNAGMKNYEIGTILEGIITKDGFISADKLKLGYRTSMISNTIFYALFRIERGFRSELVAEFSTMRANQPKGASFGSVFKNPNGDYAGRLIESVGLKGFRRGGIGFSEKHANFMINYGGASFDEAMWLINEAKRRVNEENGIILDNEVIIIGA